MQLQPGLEPLVSCSGSILRITFASREDETDTCIAMAIGACTVDAIRYI